MLRRPTRPAAVRRRCECRRSRSRLWAVLSLASILQGAPAVSAVASDDVEPIDIRSLAAPSFESFTPRDGLPEGVVTVIGVDAEGFPWAATWQGLYRFVGHRWEHRLGPEAGRVHRRMTLDSAGVLWIPTQDAGFVRLVNGEWEHRTEGDGLPSDHLYRITESFDDDGRRRLWLLTWDAGLYVLENGRWHPDPGNGSMPSGSLLSMAFTTDLFGEERQWLGTGDQGLWFRRDGERDWRQADIPDLPTGGQVEDLQVSRDAGGEALWISIFGEGLWRLDRQKLTGWRVDDGSLPSDEVYTISTVDRVEGVTTAWVASRGGLVRVRGDEVRTFDRRHGLPSDQIRSTWLWSGPQGEQVLWVATESGAARAVLTGERWRTVSLMGRGALGVFGLEIEPDGHGGERLWVASIRDGLGLYEDGVWKRFSARTGDLPGNSLRMVERALDPEGESALWAGMVDGHLVRVGEGPTFARVETPWPKRPVELVMDVLSRRRPDGAEGHELWVVLFRGGLHRLRRDGWTSFDLGREEEVRTTALAEQIEGAGRSWLWATSSIGLLRFDGDGWEVVNRVDGQDLRLLSGITVRTDSDGRQILWIGSRFEGLIRLDVSDPLAPALLSPDELPPPIDLTVYGAEHDSRGRVYLCTNVGVQQLTPIAGGWSERVFDRRDGMVHEECNTNGQLVDEHDRFWTGTLGGLTVFDPSTSLPDEPKRLRLVEMRVDDRGLDPGGEAVLGPEDRELRIEFSLQSWQREDETRYRTQILGIEDEPGPWTPRPARTLAGLPPGDHLLRVEAVDFAGVEAEPLEVGFRVVPAWWQRRSVRAGTLLALGLLVFGGVQWRMRRFLLQRQHLEARVARRTEELNRANTRLERLSYTDALTGLDNRRRLLEHVHSLLLAAPAAFDGPASLVFIDVDLFKEYNDRLGHPAGDVALRVVADALLGCTPERALVARYGGEEFACFVPDCNLDEARRLAESMRAAVEARTVEVPGRAREEHVTISAGVASTKLRVEADIHRLLREADQALYRAKDAGRNCVRS